MDFFLESLLLRQPTLMDHYVFIPCEVMTLCSLGDEARLKKVGKSTNKM
jgi:hypothetical protein